MLDVILLREAKQKNIILPTKHYGEGPDNPFSTEETFQGAYRRCNILDTEDNILKRYTGLHKNIWKLDLSSAYPAMIINFCLDIANIKNEGVTINKVNFYQNSNALLPTIAQKLINKKDLTKKELKLLNPESNEYKDLLIKYNAIKAVVNSLFGVCGLKIFRLFDYRVAASITYLVRDLLHYVENKLQEKGMEIIYIDTDSIFCQSESNPKDTMNDLIKQWAKEKYNKDRIGIEFDLEGKYEKLFIISLCHYKGLLQKKSGVEEEIKGIEAKRKDSSAFIKEFQNILIDKIMNEEPKENIIKWINSEKERIKTLSILDIGFPCKISKSAEDYKSIPVHIRALAYTKEIIPDFDKRIGDSFYYIYVEPFGTAMRKSTRNKKDKDTGDIKVQSSDKEVKKDVLVFDADNFEHVKNIDWKKMLDRSIYSKCEHIFESLNWDITEIKEAKVRQARKKKVKIDDDNCSQLPDCECDKCQ
jgi:DNA polymerase elongation subunit (family B)